ncbi:MAG: hypothetical protein ACFFG0_14650 [Candidatus Thorarchaeota archaeon]
MNSFDFDFETQAIFKKQFSNIPSTDWKKWLEISSREDYEALALKNSGFSLIPDIFERIQEEITDSKDLSVDLYNYLDNHYLSEPLIVCHSSGTTNSNLTVLKWFPMFRNLILNYWAPGMQAIFESSGLTSNSSAIIFVPSRLKTDGLNKYQDKDYISLYSSEFSQRIMLSIVNPRSYLFYEYKKSRNLEIISKILKMDNISVISAPAVTILGWADINRLKIGIKKSIGLINHTQNSKLEQLLLEIKRNGLEKTVRKIQNELSEKLASANIIFSISSLSESDWNLIRKFMKWEKGKERFTNLYVASEVGPIAASINKGDFEISRLNRMYIFPLTLPVLEYKGKKEIISRTKNKFGRLFVSRFSNSDALINIDVGDVIQVKNQEGLPQIDGKILRNQFELKYPITISNKVKILSDYKIYAGDFFQFEEFDIIEPRNFLNYLKEKCHFLCDSFLLIRSSQKDRIQWKLILPTSKNKNCITEDQIRGIILDFQESEELNQAKFIQKINIHIIEEQPINFLSTREDILAQVRSGKVPKGILKKWPLYIVEIY